MAYRMVATAIAIAGLSSAAFAHHGWGSYDAKAEFLISAPVSELVWANPHVHLMLYYDGATWEATLAPISRMQLRGLTEEMLQPGTSVVVEGYPSTARPHEMRAERITVAGQTIELR